MKAEEKKLIVQVMNGTVGMTIKFQMLVSLFTASPHKYFTCLRALLSALDASSFPLGFWLTALRISG